MYCNQIQLIVVSVPTIRSLAYLSLGVIEYEYGFGKLNKVITISLYRHVNENLERTS